MKYKLSEINLFQNGKIRVPDILHFVWIGDTNQVNLNYIDIWKKSNEDKCIYFWYDKNATLCHLFHEAISNHVAKKGFNEKINIEIDIKNRAFDYMFPKLMEGYSLNDLIFKFLSDNNIYYNNITMDALNPWFEESGIVIKSIKNLFSFKFS